MAHDAALSTLFKSLGYVFEDQSLIEQALTHRSATSVNNERLEFLGDSVLNFVIADALFHHYPEYAEGDLSRLRAHLVNGDTLAEIGRQLDLGDHLRLGPGEKKSGGFNRSSIIADALESVIGAVYCDSGFTVCQKLINRLFDEKLKNIPDPNQLKDAKTRLQELLQSKKISVPVYNVVRISGKAHAQKFEVECTIESLEIKVKGEGKSRRKAEQNAAESAIDAITDGESV